MLILLLLVLCSISFVFVCCIYYDDSRRSRFSRCVFGVIDVNSFFK